MCDECQFSKYVAIIDFGLSEVDDVPHRGEDFASSVSDKLASIRTWIEENDHVTDSQRDAIVSMVEGICKWTRTPFYPADFDDD